MKRKGFTLIELLAVIVVLAIIALIATPIVMNVIKNADKGAAERSAERYLDAVETAIATDKLNEGVVLDGTYEVDGDGNLVLDTKKLTVEVNGDLPEAGSKVGIKNGQVVVDGTNLDYGDYTVTIDSKGKATAVAKGDVVALCTAAAPSSQPWYDPNEMVMSETTAGVQATEAAPYAAGAVYTCDLGDGARTFYVLKEDGDNVKLLMNENLVDDVTWCISGWDISCEGDGAKAALADKTSGWKKLYKVGGTVELPSGQDIADAMGDTKWPDYYTGTVGPTWLWVNFDGDYGPNGYWTSTAYSVVPSHAWYVDFAGYLFHYYVDNDDHYGVRPVITISKANMSL